MEESLKDTAGKRGGPKVPQPIEGFPDFGNLNLRGVSNARDLGGLPGADGRPIKPHRLLRSGDLNAMTALDVRQLLDSCRLRHIFDLRTRFEAQRSADPILRLPGVSYTYMPALSKGEVVAADFDEIREDAHVLAEFAHDAGEYMKGLYPECLLGDEGRSAYRRLLHDLLAADEGATLWHCTQGKDRTGIAAMLVEYALGVSWEDIRKDYLATNLFMEGWLQKFQHLLDTLKVAQVLDRDLEAYSYAYEENLQAGLEAVAGEYGSLDGYMEQALGIGEEEKVQLRAMYLE